MGSYKDRKDYLPFMTKADRENELAIAQKIFKNWTAKVKDHSALRGVPFYLAFMHTRGGPRFSKTTVAQVTLKSLRFYPF